MVATDPSRTLNLKPWLKPLFVGIYRRGLKKADMAKGHGTQQMLKLAQINMLRKHMFIYTCTFIYLAVSVYYSYIYNTCIANITHKTHAYTYIPLLRNTNIYIPLLRNTNIHIYIVHIHNLHAPCMNYNMYIFSLYKSMYIYSNTYIYICIYIYIGIVCVYTCRG